MKNPEVKCDSQIKPAVLAAFGYYHEGVPVVILDEQGSILHGEETLKQITEYGASLKCMTISGVNRVLFEAGEAPEFLEAARQVFWEQRREGKP